MANQINAIVRTVSGLQMLGSANSGHAVVIDTSAAGGSNQGSSPMELVLIALGGCSAMDVVSIMGKKREPLVRLEVVMSGERRDEYPQIFTGIQMHYKFFGKGLSNEACRKSIELSHEKYCSVAAMLVKAASIDHDWEIIEDI